MFSKAYGTDLKIDYNNVDGFNRYPSDLMGEYKQSIEEGLDVEKYKNLFEAVSSLPNGKSLLYFSTDVLQSKGHLSLSYCYTNAVHYQPLLVPTHCHMKSRDCHLRSDLDVPT